MEALDGDGTWVPISRVDSRTDTGGYTVLGLIPKEHKEYYWDSTQVRQEPEDNDIINAKAELKRIKLLKNGHVFILSYSELEMKFSMIDYKIIVRKDEFESAYMRQWARALHYNPLYKRKAKLETQCIDGAQVIVMPKDLAGFFHMYPGYRSQIGRIIMSYCKPPAFEHGLRKGLPVAPWIRRPYSYGKPFPNDRSKRNYYKECLRFAFRARAPEKLGEVKSMLAANNGKEEQLLQSLCLKYRLPLANGSYSSHCEVM